MKTTERWTLELECDVDAPESAWEHVNGKATASVVTQGAGRGVLGGLLTAMEDGLHWHAYQRCDGPVVPWRVVKRQAAADLSGPPAPNLPALDTAPADMIKA